MYHDKFTPNNRTRAIGVALLCTLLTLLLQYYGVPLARALPPTVAINEWTTTTALPQALANRNAVVKGDYLLMVGGKSDAGIPISTIYSARINSDGSLGAWRASGQLPVALYLHSTIVAGDALFVIGGWDGAKTRAEVWRATIGTNGDVGNWTAASPYPVDLDLHDAVLLNNHIYVTGGWNGSAALQGVYAAPVLNNGLGNWKQVGSLPTPTYRLAAASINGNLYVTGGYDGSGNELTTVWVAAVDGTNALGAWRAATDLPGARYYHKTVIHDNRLVLLGGQNDTGVFANVYSARIRSDGLLDAWQEEVALPAPIYRFGAVTVTRNGSDLIYVTGGLRNETTYQSAVYHSTVPLPPTATPTTTPTITPTPTPSPTPTPALSLNLQNAPSSWLAPGEETMYTITYKNGGTDLLTNVEIFNVIPNGVELVEGSIQTSAGDFSASGTAPGATIVWTIGDVNGRGSGSVAYRVRRQVTPTPAVPLALEIAIAAPAIADANAEVVYAITLTNRSPIVLTNLVITNTLPVDATYLRGAEGAPTNGVVRWQVASLAAESSATVQYTVAAAASLVNYDYRAVTGEGVNARGRVMAITLVDGRPPQVGDGFIIVNQGARAIVGDGRQRQLASNAVFNPSHILYLPSIQR